jgi:5-methylcytosine-specific restriction endonuclease McrA
MGDYMDSFEEATRYTFLSSYFTLLPAIILGFMIHADDLPYDNFWLMALLIIVGAAIIALFMCIPVGFWATLLTLLVLNLATRISDRKARDNSERLTKLQSMQGQEVPSTRTPHIQSTPDVVQTQQPKPSQELSHRHEGTLVPAGYQQCRITEDLISNQRLQRLKTMPYQEYLSTPEWRARRDEMLRRAGNRCQVTNRSDSLEVHHRTYDRRGHEVPGDLTVLHRECHRLVHEQMGMPVND